MPTSFQRFGASLGSSSSSRAMARYLYHQRKGSLIFHLSSRLEPCHRPTPQASGGGGYGSKRLTSGFVIWNPGSGIRLVTSTRYNHNTSELSGLYTRCISFKHCEPAQIKVGMSEDTRNHGTKIVSRATISCERSAG